MHTIKINTIGTIRSSRKNTPKELAATNIKKNFVGYVKRKGFVGDEGNW